MRFVVTLNGKAYEVDVELDAAKVLGVSASAAFAPAYAQAPAFAPPYAPPYGAPYMPYPSAPPFASPFAPPYAMPYAPAQPFSTPAAPATAQSVAQAAAQPVAQAAAPAAPAPAPASAPTSSEAPSGEAVSAPMPGAIVDVRVSTGQAVKKDEVLVILEAMKMENEIVSPRDTTVTGVAVSKGDTVSPGQTLLWLA